MGPVETSMSWNTSPGLVTGGGLSTLSVPPEPKKYVPPPASGPPSSHPMLPLPSSLGNWLLYANPAMLPLDQLFSLVAALR